MNILFVYTSEIIPEDGGVQRVTDVLRNYFEKQNNTVIYLSMKRNKEKSTNNAYQYFIPYEKNIYDEQNISYYIDLVKKNKIDIIINQAALGGTLVQFCSYAKSVSNAKIISVIHNSLLGNVINFTNTHSYQINKLNIKFLTNFLELKVISTILKTIYIMKYRRAYMLTCEQSDHVVLLSKYFYNELEAFVPNCDLTKISSIPNPCTVNVKNNIFNKENELLYVGRINTSQKKVDLLLKIWEIIYKKHPNWNLSILGEGEEKISLERTSQELGLERIKFYGLQNPISFYERAKILCMTSAYEGFGLVLVEAQSFGTIPIAFDSFASAKDIIIDDYNGFLIEPFNVEKYADRLSALIENNEKMNIMSQNCKESINTFSMDTVGEKWIELFSELKSKTYYKSR